MPLVSQITEHDIDAAILHEAYYVFPGTNLTVCALTLNNRFIVTGESCCIDNDNFNAEIGRNIARKNAREKIWQFKGYEAMSNNLGWNKCVNASTYSNQAQSYHDKISQLNMNQSAGNLVGGGVIGGLYGNPFQPADVANCVQAAVPPVVRGVL